jgi:transcriptional antiterminator NusG
MEQCARWYIVQVYTGSENRVVQLIKEVAAKKGVIDDFEDLVIPTEQVIEVKGGVRVKTDRQYFPGYILMKVKLSEDIQHLIRSIPKVSGILGTDGVPTPVSEAEIKRVMKNVADSKDSPRNTVMYDVGDQVKILEGPFASFIGHVEEVEESAQRLKLTVMIFGRATPISLDLAQVVKV